MPCKLNAPTAAAPLQAYGRELAEAAEWCNKYRVSRKESDLHQAWDLYYHVFKRINKQLPSLTVLELQYVAPALVRAQVSPAPWREHGHDATWPCSLGAAMHYACIIMRSGRLPCMRLYWSKSKRAL